MAIIVRASLPICKALQIEDATTACQGKTQSKRPRYLDNGFWRCVVLTLGKEHSGPCMKSSEKYDTNQQDLYCKNAGKRS